MILRTLADAAQTTPCCVQQLMSSSIPVAYFRDLAAAVLIVTPICAILIWNTAARIPRSPYRRHQDYSHRVLLSNNYLSYVIVKTHVAAAQQNHEPA